MKIFISFACFLMLAGCSSSSSIEPEITNFEECIQAGNPAMESYPRQCRANDKTFTEQIDQPVEKDILPTKKACTREYRPVCGRIEVQCIKAPCDPIKKTFPNRCVAENAQAMKIVDGSCDDIVKKPDLKICTMEYVPVCGKTEEGLKTFSNRCVAEGAGATSISDGDCMVKIKKDD